jgi:hypothetical protein
MNAIKILAICIRVNDIPFNIFRDPDKNLSLLNIFPKDGIAAMSVL